MCQDTLESHAENLTKKCLCLAYQGNLAALRLCMERLMPARRQRALRFKLPPVKTIAEVAAASELVVSAVSRGQLTTDEGQAFSMLLEGHCSMIETQELEQRIRTLEELNKPSTEPI